MTNIKPYHDEIKLYKRRWLLMILFMWYTVASGIHWVEFSSINSIVSNYYKVSSIWIEWTTMVYMVAVIVFIFPLLYLLDKTGIRNFLIMSNILLCIGATIKILSVKPDRYYILMIGQSFNSVSIVFTYCLVGRFTAVWFGNKEISRAGALILIGDQMGGAFSFLIPNMLVVDSPHVNVVEEGMMRMHIIYASAAFITLTLVVLFFKEEPKRPPSVAQALRKEEEMQNVGKSLVEIFSNLSFWSVSISYGLGVSSCQIFSTFLNELVLHNFKDRVTDTGNLGFLFLISGMISSLLFSYILDKTRKFKENAIFLNMGSFISLGLMAITLKLDTIIYLYIITIVFGLFFRSMFIMAIYATGIQMGIEATYPVPENLVGGVMLFFVQVISVVTTFIFGIALREYDDVRCIIGLALTLLLSTIFACLFPSDLRRERTEKSDKTVELKEFLPAQNVKKGITVC